MVVMIINICPGATEAHQTYSCVSMHIIVTVYVNVSFVARSGTVALDTRDIMAGGFSLSRSA